MIFEIQAHRDRHSGISKNVGMAFQLLGCHRKPLQVFGCYCYEYIASSIGHWLLVELSCLCFLGLDLRFHFVS
jgi:hypothetical protein